MIPYDESIQFQHHKSVCKFVAVNCYTSLDLDLYKSTIFLLIHNFLFLKTREFTHL